MWTSPRYDAAVRVREVWLRRRPGPLLVRFDVPALELGAVIDRGWHLELRRDDFPRVFLMLPDYPEYLPAYPMPAPSQGWLRSYHLEVFQFGSVTGWC